MKTCKKCGGNSPDKATVCRYCDTPFKKTRGRLKKYVKSAAKSAYARAKAQAPTIKKGLRRSLENLESWDRQQSQRNPNAMMSLFGSSSDSNDDFDLLSGGGNRNKKKRPPLMF